MKKSLIVLLYAIGFSQAGCGVRGDPVPPDSAPVIGRGEPNFSRAAQAVTPNNDRKKKMREQSWDEESEGEH